jgi:all-trans-retinol 13,14-reductase
MVNSESLRKSYINRIIELENSIGVFSLNVTFKEASFPYENHNTYFFQNYQDVWHATNYIPEKWPDNYAFYQTQGDHGYAKSAAILCYMKFSEVARWKDTYNTVFQPSSRDDGYLEFKEKKAELLFKFIESNHPGFIKAVNSYHTSTPLTLRDYTGTPNGSIYGIVRDYKNPIRTFIPSRTKIKNLLLTGQNLSLHGVLGVSVSALVTCGELLNLDSLLADIRRF